jgi:hypothetical protein
MNISYLFSLFYDIFSAYLPSLIILNIIHLIIFVLLIIFSQKQPLKSRGLIPFLAFLRYFISSFFTFVQYGKIEYYELGCYFKNLIEVPLTYASFCFIPLTLLRYIIIANLNGRKQNISKTKKSKNNLFLVILKYSLHPIVTLIIYFLLIFNFLSVNIGLVFGLRCDTDLESVPRYLNIVFYTLMIISCAILFFIDIVSNVKKIFSKCGICNLFWKYDAYYFRSEMYIVGLGITASMYVIVTFLDFLYSNQPYVLVLSTGFLLNFFVFFFQSGFVLLVTVVNFFMSIFRRRSKKRLGYLIEKLLENSEFHDLFEEYSKSEWSPENLCCYDDIIEFEKNPSIEKLNPMIDLYFNGASSELEVNVPGELISVLKEKINKGKISNSILVSIKSVVVRNLLDTYSRFIWTSSYKQFIFRNEAFGENIEKK